MCSNSKRTRRSGTSTASNSWYGTHRSVGFPDRSRHSKNHDPGAKFSKKLMWTVTQLSLEAQLNLHKRYFEVHVLRYPGTVCTFLCLKNRIAGRYHHSTKFSTKFSTDWYGTAKFSTAWYGTTASTKFSSTWAADLNLVPWYYYHKTAFKFNDVVLFPG